MAPPAGNCAEAPQDRRKSARTLLFDSTGRVLLIRFVVSRGGREFAFWATPGGTIEAGETPNRAARRELREELALVADLTGPVHESDSTFEHEGRLIQNTDIFFIVRVADARLNLSGVTAEEIRAMRVLKWWSAADIDQSSETFFPPELPALVRTFGVVGRHWTVQDAKAEISQAGLVRDETSYTRAIDT
jgi:8-oxo-dGTP pyrophosphatase MutT (NUDIX family)